VTADVSGPGNVVHRLVADVINAGDLDVLDELCVEPLAPKLRKAFAEFRAAFPDWHQEIVELVTEGETVVARFRCTGTQRGAWRGLPPTERRMKIDEVYFFRITDGRISGLWGLEDNWTRMRQLRGVAGDMGELGSLS
jgi:ketosteroid isomerase-like protein